MKAARHEVGGLSLSRSTVLLLGATAALALGAAVVARGDTQQGPTVPPESAPAMKYIPPEERARLAQEVGDLKDRTRLSIELAEARLTRAEQYTNEARFVRASAELGIYQALMEEIIRFLQRSGPAVNGKVPNKVRDLFKRLELALRAHGPRLEAMRRVTPSEEAANVRAVYEFTRSARAEALESFYGETVLREGSSQKAAPSGERKKDAPPTPEEKQD